MRLAALGIDPASWLDISVRCSGCTPIGWSARRGLFRLMMRDDETIGEPHWRQPEPAAGVPLLASKLSPPRTPRRLVARGRLVELLDAGVQGRLTLLTGPAGSGKTVLLSSWVTTAALPGPAAWVSLDANDNDPARFWSYLLAALRQSGVAPRGGRLHSLGLPIGGPDRRFVLELAATLAELAGPVVVVLDDVQELTNPAVLDGLATVLRRSSASLRLVLASREEAPLPLTRLPVADRRIKVGAAELAFTADEAATLLVSHGLVLADADLAVVWARTEGWAAGLRLAALSLQDHPDPGGFVARFAGSSRAVADFLLEEVLGRLPEEDQAFLLHTSVVERLSGELADALTGRADGAQTLARLERTNAFVVALDEDRAWYRYHQLLTDVLHDRIQASTPRLVPELHRRAAGWYQDHGFPIEATRHALAGREWPLAAGLLASNWQGFILDGEMALLGELVDQFPAEVVEADAELVTVRAARRLGAGDWDGADSDLRLAQQVAADLPRWRRRRFAVAFATVSLYRARLRGDLDAALVAARQILPAGGDLVADADLRALALLNLGIAEFWTGALEAAGRDLRAGLAAARRAGRDGLVVGLLGQLAAVTGASRMGDGVRLAREALALAERRGWSQSPSAACAYLVLGGAHFEWGDLAAAARYLDLAMACRPEPAISVTIGLTRAAMAHAKGDPAAGLAILRGAQQELQRLNGPYVLAASLREWETRLLAATGHLEQAQAVLPASDEPGPPSVATLVVRAESELAAGDPAAAVTTLRPCLDGSVPPLVPNQMLETLLLDAVARQRLGDVDGAAASVEQALQVGEPEGYRQVFWTLGEEVNTLLLRQRERGTAHPRFLAELLDRPTAPAAPARSPLPVGLAAPLTDRERAVLGLLDSDLSTRQIADELYVSVSVLRSDVRDIYRKLNASHRGDAVRRARHHGLL
jgi:LuxR family transcriptional regulator, maltose regulon positive regulatory protein